MVCRVMLCLRFGGVLCVCYVHGIVWYVWLCSLCVFVVRVVSLFVSGVCCCVVLVLVDSWYDCEFALMRGVACLWWCVWVCFVCRCGCLGVRVVLVVCWGCGLCCSALCACMWMPCVVRFDS